MPFTKTELAALKHRVSQAFYNGYQIAYAAEYVQKLGNGPPPSGAEPFSAKHILHLIELAEKTPPAPPPASVRVQVTPPIKVVAPEPAESSEPDAVEAQPEAPVEADPANMGTADLSAEAPVDPAPEKPKRTRKKK